MKEKKNPKKTIIYFYIITLIIVLILNAFIFPSIMKQEITQVDYSTFLNHIEKGSIKTVEIQDNRIAYTEVDKEGKDVIYITGSVDDPELVNRLHASGVKFSKVIPI